MITENKMANTWKESEILSVCDEGDRHSPGFLVMVKRNKSQKTCLPPFLYMIYYSSPIKVEEGNVLIQYLKIIVGSNFSDYNVARGRPISI